MTFNQFLKLILLGVLKSGLVCRLLQICFEHILLISSEGLGTSSNNLIVPLLEVIQYVMPCETFNDIIDKYRYTNFR